MLSNTIKQKRKEKAGKWEVPLPKVRPIAEDEMFRVMRTGKRMKKSWKRMITKATFVGEGFTRKPPKYERFIRPSGLRFNKAHVTHPELNATFQLDILGVKKNPNGQMFTSLGVLTKGTVIEVNVSELGLVTPAGKVVWGKYAQITNNPENDGCIKCVQAAQAGRAVHACVRALTRARCLLAQCGAAGLRTARAAVYVQAGCGVGARARTAVLAARAMPSVVVGAAVTRKSWSHLNARTRAAAHGALSCQLRSMPGRRTCRSASEW